MGCPIRVLLVEDVEQDALLIARELKRGGFDVTFERVDTPEAMSAALARQAWDLVVSDYRMPRFDAPAALALTRAHNLDLPFIIVSGTVGEDVAVASLRAGAHDYMAKGRLARLVPAVERELREAARRAEERQLKEHLRISERMASVGTLAAGVAHEINNPLTALMANLVFACDDVEKLLADQRAQDGAAAAEGSVAARLGAIAASLGDAREAAVRVRDIVRDLKLFSRRDEEKTEAVDLRGVLESALRIAGNEVRHRARLVEDYGAVPPVRANEGRLGQVFVNLVTNAAQAISEGDAEHNEIRVSTRSDAEGRVVVDVSDTGAGIPDTVLPRIFEPFFTTKPIGEGTGLGLAICHRIISAFGGSLEVETKLGKGTTFRVILPVADPPTVVAPAPAPEPVAAEPASTGRILVVDDERLVGMVARRMLETKYDVVSLTRARDALERVAAGERYDVLLCDLMMPDVTGMDLHAELLKSAPEQARRVVFMTGGAFTPRARDFLDSVPNLHLEKPFDSNQLFAVVTRALR
ncbi:MAG: response regulator [Myxococcota bacterium]